MLATVVLASIYGLAVLTPSLLKMAVSAATGASSTLNQLTAVLKSNDLILCDAKVLVPIDIRNEQATVFERFEGEHVAASAPSPIRRTLEPQG